MDFCFSTICFFMISRWCLDDSVLRSVEVCKLLFGGCVFAVVAAIELQEQIQIATATAHSIMWFVA